MRLTVSETGVHCSIEFECDRPLSSSKLRPAPTMSHTPPTNPSSCPKHRYTFRDVPVGEVGAFINKLIDANGRGDALRRVSRWEPHSPVAEEYDEILEFFRT